MPQSNKVNRQFFEAVRNGDLSTVEKFINDYGLSYSPDWLDGYALLCTATRHKQTKAAKLLLRNGSEVNCKDGNSVMTPLYYAVENNNVEVVEMLLNKGAHVDIEASDGSTPLLIAIRSNYSHIICLLLDHGAAFDVASTGWNESGGTLLHFACVKGHKNVVDLLLRRHADVNARDRNGSTPLHDAFDNEIWNSEIVECLLTHGADINAKNLKNQTPLTVAVNKDSLTTVRHILSYKPDSRDEYNRLALRSAVKINYCSYLVDAPLMRKLNSKQILEDLLNYGFAIKPHDVADTSLLHAAAGIGYEQIVEDLLIYGADVNHLETTAWGQNSLFGTAIRGGQNSIVQLLIKYGANVNIKDETGCTPLYLAIKYGYEEIVENLLICGADVNYSATTAWGINSPLCTAIDRGKHSIVQLLLKYGADVNCKDETGWTPIYLAIEYGYEEIIENLLIGGADVNYTATTAEGKNSPLYTAVQKNQHSIVQLLIKYGADVESKDELGRTPINVAISYENLEIAMQLLDNKAVVESSFDLLCLGMKTGNTKTVEKMLSYNGVNINGTDSSGITALHLASRWGRTEMVKFLLDKGANIDAMTADGKTALYEACINRCNEVVEILLEFGAQSEFEGTGDAVPLHAAIENNDEKVVEILLRYDTDIEFKNQSGRTPLFIALRRRNKDIVNILLEHGSDISILSNLYYYIQSASRETNRHMIELTAANLYVNEENLRLMNSFECKNYLTKREEEIKNMKSEKIVDNISFYDILTKEINKLIVYSRNEKIMQVLTTNDYKTKFPIYASMIHLRFKKGMRRNVLLEQSYRFFHILSNGFPVLPHDCIENIFNYFSNYDLRKFIKACE